MVFYQTCDVCLHKKRSDVWKVTEPKEQVRVARTRTGSAKMKKVPRKVYNFARPNKNRVRRPVSLYALADNPNISVRKVPKRKTSKKDATDENDQQCLNVSKGSKKTTTEKNVNSRKFGRKKKKPKLKKPVENDKVSTRTAYKAKIQRLCPYNRAYRGPLWRVLSELIHSVQYTDSVLRTSLHV